MVFQNHNYESFFALSYRPYFSIPAFIHGVSRASRLFSAIMKRHKDIPIPNINRYNANGKTTKGERERTSNPVGRVIEPVGGKIAMYYNQRRNI
jgi:hypothetical protein